MNFSYYKRYDKSQTGFTLIELMVSLVLGLIISAAAVQVYIINTKTAGTQASASELVENTVFNLPTIERKVRLASLGMSDKANADLPGSGIVLTSANNALKDKDGKVQLDNLRNSTDIDADTSLPKNITIGDSIVKVSLLTHSGDQNGGSQANEWTGVSNVDAKSGQLTIQYRAPQDMYDCEGNLALGPRRVNIGGVLESIDGQVIIERFYLKAPDATKPAELSLYCDAGKYITEIMDDYSEQSKPSKKLGQSVEFTVNNKIRDFGDAGQEIIAHVDYFDILLSTTNGGLIQYYSVGDYLDLDTRPDIVGIKYGLILRSDNAVLTNASPTEFTLLGSKIELKEDLNKSYQRTAVESDITLRNTGFG